MGCCCSRTEEPIVFPEPQGPYSVGCADIMTNATEDDKGLFVRLFYPIDKVNIKDHISELTPSVPEPAEKYSDGLVHMATPCCFPLAKCLVKNQLGPCYTSKSAALWNAPLATDGGPFRLVVLATGFAGFRSSHCVFSANLASHGFVVATTEPKSDACYTYAITLEGTKEELWGDPALNMPIMHQTNYDRYFAIKENVAPFHKLLGHRLKELLNTLELFNDMTSGKGCFGHGPSEKCIVVGKDFDWGQFLGRIRTENAALVGHSFGGATSVAAMSCPQFSYFVHFDPQMFVIDDQYYSEMEKIRPAKALFFIQDMQNMRVERGKLALMHKASEHGKCGNNSVLRILKSNHFSFSDSPYFKGCLCNMMSRDPIPVNILQPIIDGMVLALLTDDNEKMNYLLTKYKDHIVVEL